jgi:hypothetical protein
LVPRYTLDVSADLTAKGIGVGLAWIITRLVDNTVVKLDIDHIKTNPGDPGGYVLWYSGMKAADFYPEEIYKFQAFAFNQPENILAVSDEWYFYVDDRP